MGADRRLDEASWFSSDFAWMDVKSITQEWKNT